MALIQQFVSDVSGRPIKAEDAAKVTIQYPGQDKVRVIDCAVEELGAFADKGTLQAKRGRKPVAA